MNRPLTSTPPWTERYEALRRHVMGDEPVAGIYPLGLAVLQQRGLTHWIQAWTRGAIDEPHSLPSRASTWSPPTPPAWQQELTQLIAHMTIQLLHPMQPL